MKTKVLPTMQTVLKGLIAKTLAAILVIALVSNTTQAATKTSTGTGNWSSNGTWSPSGVPASGDDVVIPSGHTVTVDGNYTCHNLDIGDATGANATVQITTVAKSLTITGDLTINAANKGLKTFTLDAGPGTVNINGTITYAGANGNDVIQVGSGTVNITPALSISDNSYKVTFTGAGTINFNGAFTDGPGSLTTYTGCNVYFASSYTVSSSTATWGGMGTAHFKNGSSITPTASMTFNDIDIVPSATVTMNSAAGAVSVAGSVTLGSGSSFTCNESLTISGNWTNNGGTFSNGTSMVTFTGTVNTISGTGTTAFYDVLIPSGDSVLLSGICTMHNFTLGNATASNAIFKLTSASASMTVNGDLSMNPSNKNNTINLDAGAGTVNIAGTFGTYGWGTTVPTKFTIGTGSMTFTPAVSALYSVQDFVFTGAGTLTFNGAFADQYNSITTFAGCNVNFGSSYTVSNTNASWGGLGTANFTGASSSVTPTTAITFNNVSVAASKSVTLNTGAGAVIMAGNVTLGSGSTFTASKSFEVDGNWTNNGGTLSGGANTITFNGASNTIDGTSSTSFPILQLGNTTTAVSYTMNNSNTCSYIVFNANSVARTLTLGSSGVTLSVTNNVTINQPTASVTNLLDVSAGTCNVTGNLIFSGASSVTTYVAKVNVTSGAFTVNGTVTWMGNTAVATEVITVSTGSVTFGSSLTMGSASGTLAVTGTGTINFNGSSAPSFTFGGATAPVFTTTNGSTINFAKGFTNSTSAYTFAATSTVNFSGTGTITPTAAITFGHLGVNASYTGTIAAGTATVAGDVTIGSGAILALNQNLQVGGSWTNNGGTLSASGRTITFNGTAGATIGGTGTTAFPAVVIGKSGAGAVSVSYIMNNDNSMTSLAFDGNTLPRSLTLGSGKTLTISGDLTINQPTIATYTNLFDVSAGTCNISGNMTFSGASTTATKVAKLNVTSGNFTLAGTLTWMAATSVATEVIAVNTGTLNFSSPISLTSGTGTIDVNGAATVNFNGASTPSFTFGGTTTPVFNIASGSAINFAKGFSSPTTALTFPAGSTVTSGSVASPVNFTVTGSNTITNNSNMTVYGDLVGTLPGSAFVNGANASLTIYGSVMSTGTFTATAAGNTVTYAGSSAQSVKTGTYNSLILSGAGAKTLGGAITADNITLSSASLDDAGYTIAVTGANGWTNNSGTYTTTGGVSFTGATPSQIGGTSATTFKSLTINKSGGVTLNAPVNISSALTLTSGVITTSATNYLKLAAAATASTGSASTYVNGPMIKVGNTAFTFPLGNAGRWRRVGVSGMANAATQVTAQYFAATPPNTSTKSSTISDVSTDEYWDVDRTVTTDPIKIRLYWESKPLQSLSLDCSSLTVAHYKSGQWQQETATMISAPTTCLLGVSGSIETDWVSSFSPFGFGGSGGGSLPIKLVSFDAVLSGKVVETRWITELEINNAYFTLERSTDVETWEEVARVDGAGNSTNMLTYEKADVNPKIGTTYYRLKQTDFDGQFTYSNIVPVTVEGVQSSFTVYPNPTDNEMTLNVANPSDEINVTIYDLTGRKMYARTFPVDKGSSTHEITIQAKYLLPTGVYMMSVATNGTEQRERVVLN